MVLCNTGHIINPAPSCYQTQSRAKQKFQIQIKYDLSKDGFSHFRLLRSGWCMRQIPIWNCNRCDPGVSLLLNDIQSGWELQQGSPQTLVIQGEPSLILILRFILHLELVFFLGEPVLMNRRCQFQPLLLQIRTDMLYTLFAQANCDLWFWVTRIKTTWQQTSTIQNVKEHPLWRACRLALFFQPLQKHPECTRNRAFKE